jgi:energy-coupling factor transport system substrate-specific component
MSTRTLALIPLCVALNVVMGGLIHVLKIPIYYDAVGTIVAAIILGFFSGSLVGILSFALMAILVSPVYIYFLGTQVAIAGFTYLVASYLAGFRTILRSIASGIGLGVVAGIISAPVIVYVFGGATGSGRDLMTAIIAASGQQIMKAVALSGLASEPIDKTVQVLTAVMLIRGIPASLRTLFDTTAVNRNFNNEN